MPTVRARSSANSGQIVGVEALLRSNHRTRGPISSAGFIPRAEEQESRAECLDQLGCDLGQGFLYANAVPPEKLTMLRAASRAGRIAS